MTITATTPAIPDALDGQFMTPEAYLEMERRGIREFHGKYELFNQTLRFMSGATTSHNDISAHITALFQWFIWQSDLKAHIAQSDMKVVSFLTYKNYFYPDNVFTMAERVYHDIKKDVLVNPTIIVEVLSDDTESFDRGDKFQSYRQIESLQEYILVSQYRRRIEHFYKNNAGLWVVGKVVESGGLSLKSIDFQLVIDKVYHDLPF